MGFDFGRLVYGVVDSLIVVVADVVVLAVVDVVVLAAVAADNVVVAVAVY